MIRWVPDRRSLIVLVALLTAMTLVSALLMMLEPRRHRSSPLGSPLNLTSLNGTPRDAQRQVFTLTAGVELARWSSIVIHLDQPTAYRQSTATALPSLEPLSETHTGYHFWIENAHDGQDGRIRISPNWLDQFDLTQQQTGQPDGVIHIKLGLNTAQRTPSPQQISSLLWLVQRLQYRCQVPAGQVMLNHQPRSTRHGDHVASSDSTESAPWIFPVAQFRQQLLTLATPNDY